MYRALSVVLAVACSVVGCGPQREPGSAGEPKVEWALALHGGAGTIPKTVPQERKEAYLAALEGAVASGREMLERGDAALDVVEAVIRRLEDDPLFNAGKGAVFNHEGEHELDASIMNGRDLACGAVAGVRIVRNPISLARLVMERTDHVLLAGPGADAFARETGVALVAQDYFFTQARHDAWKEALAREAAPSGAGGSGASGAAHRGTVGVAALDRHGDLAAGTSTGGLTNKKFGRVGDSPIVGAGTYADNRTCAVSATGIGEQFIRHGVAHSVSAMMEHAGVSLAEAARAVIRDKLTPGDGGIIAVSHTGEIAMEFNTTGMFRGAADSSGRFEARIWE